MWRLFDFDVQEPLAYGRGDATATVSKRLNTQAENALRQNPGTRASARREEA
jgi:hypothetical protein